MTAPGVVVTRDEGPEGPLTVLLRARGFDVHHWPTIEVVPPEDPAPLRQALAELDTFDWVVITSRRAVAPMVREGPGAEGTPAAMASEAARPRVAAVGEATADALRDAGWPVDLVPATQTGAALVAALHDAGIGPGTRVLFPASAIARDTVPDGLAEAGAEVVQVEAYRTRPAALDADACRAALASGSVVVVTFTSPSTVAGLAKALGPVLALVRERTRAVAIGPTTGAAAREAGFDVVVAEPHSLEGLAERVAMLAAT